MKSRTAAKERAMQEDNFRQGITRRRLADGLLAGRPVVDAAAGWDEFLLLASKAVRPAPLEPLPNFGEIAPHVK